MLGGSWPAPRARKPEALGEGAAWPPLHAASLCLAEAVRAGALACVWSSPGCLFGRLLPWGQEDANEQVPRAKLLVFAPPGARLASMLVLQVW